MIGLKEGAERSFFLRIAAPFCELHFRVEELGGKHQPYRQKGLNNMISSVFMIHVYNNPMPGKCNVQLDTAALTVCLQCKMQFHRISLETETLKIILL